MQLLVKAVNGSVPDSSEILGIWMGAWRVLAMKGVS
jgi:hypothetical protein